MEFTANPLLDQEILTEMYLQMLQDTVDHALADIIELSEWYKETFNKLETPPHYKFAVR